MRYTDLIRGTNGKIRKAGQDEFIPSFNLMGKKIGRLYVKEFSHKKDRTYYYKCVCDCGNECIKSSYYLLNDKKNPHKSCGCWHKELTLASSTIHGMTRTPTYKVWEEMKTRCCNPQNQAYKDYAGRGIKVCDRWLNSFENFLEDMGERPSKEYSIDRIDNNGDYEPSNCRWATRVEQCNNRRSNIAIEYNGKKQNLKQWCNELGLKYSCVESMRLRTWRTFDEIVEFYKNKRK